MAFNCTSSKKLSGQILIDLISVFIQFVNYPHTMWERDAEGNRILQMVKQETDHDLLSQAAASIKQVNSEA